MKLLYCLLGCAGWLGLSLAIARPATADEAAPVPVPLQVAQVPTACPPGYVPESPVPFEPRIGYNLECWGLTRSGWICANNPNPECGAELADSFS